jgi:sortase (surface protein transpeptidase)
MEPKGQRARRFWVVLVAVLVFSAVAPTFSDATTPGERTSNRHIETDSLRGPDAVDVTRAMFINARLTAGDPGEVRDAAGRAAALAADARAAAATSTKAARAVARAARKAPVIRNHLWIPGLGISQPVYSHPCWRSQGPANYVYRWGCAGRNNIYLLGHAYGVFKALHDAYVSGRLRVGMVATYADSYGRITRYRVTVWQVVLPTQTWWAMSSQRRPSMTLQTCMGAWSQYRLNVRLVSF